jgi:hypothetical protein
MTPVRPAIVSPPRKRLVVLRPSVGTKYGSSTVPVVASFLVVAGVVEDDPALREVGEEHG